MKNRRAVVIVLAVAACLAVILLSRCDRTKVQQHTPGMTEQEEHNTMQEDAAGSTAVVVTERTVSEADLLNAIQNSCAALELEELSVSVTEDAAAICSGTVTKKSVTKLLQSKSGSITSAYESVLSLLPDALPVALQLRFYAQNGSLCAEILSMKIADMELPEDVLAADICKAAADGIAGLLSADLTEVQSVSAKDGQLVLTGS